MKKIIPDIYRFAIAGLLMLSGAVMAADPVPVYYLINGGSADSDIKILNLSSSATANSILVDDGTNSSSISVNAGAIGTLVDSASGMNPGATISGSSGKPFIAMGTGNGTGMPLFTPGFAGQTFIIPHYSGDHRYYLYNPTGSAISVTVTLNGTPDTFNLASGLTEYDAGTTNTISGIVEAASDIYVAHREDGGTSWAYAVPPAAQSVLGVKSGSVLLGASEDDTSVTVYTSGNATATIDLDAGERVVVSTGTAATQNSGDALRLVSNSSSKPIAAIQVDDGDGSQATAFWSENLLSLHSGVAVDTQYIAVVCRYPAVIKLHDGATTTTKTCQANGNYPGKEYFGSATNAGARLESSSPVYFVAENSANDDESNLWSYEPDTIIVNTTTASSITTNTTWHTGNVYQMGSNLTINTGVTLTIEPGVVVITTAVNKGIVVEGTLTVQGTAVAPVIFTTEETTDEHSKWEGIQVKSGATATFDYAEIERAEIGIEFYDTGSAGYVSHSVLHHNSKAILLYMNAYPEIKYSSIHDNTNGIYIEPTATPTNNPSASIHHNAINANTNGIYILVPSNTDSTDDPKPVVQYNDLSGNSGKAYLISGGYQPSGMSVTTLDANYNWWGSTVVTQIDAAITDELDTASIDAVVDFNHYATSSAVSAFSSNQVLVGNHYNKTITLAANAQHTQLGAFTLGAGSTMTIGDGASYTINDEDSDLVVEGGASLTIDKNSIITFYSTSTQNASTSSIEVYGTFEADGDDLNRITFKSSQSTLDASKNYWDGIHVRAGGDAYFDYVNIEQADGLHYYDGTWGSVTNSSLRYNKYGVYVEGDADILSIGNHYTYNQYGVYVVGGSTGTGEHMPQPVFIWDLISANTAYGVYATSSGNANDARPSVSGSAIVDNGGSGVEKDYYLAGTWADPLLVLNATQCYWGVDNYTLVSETLVYDHMDDAALPYVDFGKILIDISSDQLEQLTGETLIGSIGTATTLDENTTYTLISSLDITSTLNLGDGTVLIVPDGFNINVASGGTLYMGAGSRIEFEDAASRINVTGTLTIDGSSTDLVYLTNDGAGLWYGIVVNSGGTVDIDYVHLSYAQYGIYFSDGSSGVVAHSSFIANTKGIYIIGNSDPEISYSTISSNVDGIYIAGLSTSSGAPEPDIHHNTISGNTTGINLDPVFVANKEPAPDITYNTIFNNTNYNLTTATGNFANASTHVINARNNWWGTADVAQIHVQIYDRQYTSFSAASNHKPTVDFGSFALSSALSSFKANTLAGPILSNTTLTADTTYTVISHVSVAEGVTLTIPDNVQLQIAALYSQDAPSGGGGTRVKALIEFEVNGYLEINGDDENTSSVVEYARFTSLASTPAVADWEGIIVNEGGRLWMDHAEVAYANHGVHFKDGTDGRSQIWASLIHDHQSAAIKMQGGLSPHEEAPEDGIWLMGNVLYNSIYGVEIDIASTDAYSPPKSKMVYNWIKNMSSWGVWIGSDNGSTASRNPVIVINGNGFENNGSAGKSNLFLEKATWPSAGTLDAQYNLWSHFDPEVIATTISDRVDASANQAARTPLVDFRNYTIEWVDEETLTSQAKDILGPITEDTTLSVSNGDTHVTLIGDVTIPEGIVLTIEEGVQVFVSGDYTLQVDGVLVVNGTATNPVVFSSDDLNPAVNDWQGIVVSSTGAAQIVNAVIQNANKGITFDSVSATVTINSVTYTNKVDDSIIQNNNYGIWCVNTPSSLPITDNLIQFNSNYGLYFEGSAGAQVTGNLITNNGRGIYLLGNSSNSALNPTPTINNNSIFDNSVEVEIHDYHSSIQVNLQSNWWEHTPTVGTASTYDVYASGSSGTGNANVANHLTTDPAIAGSANDLTVSRDYISPNNDSVQDTVNITGTLQLSASWTVKIRNYAGTVVKTYTGSGTSVSATWDGKDSQSTPAVVPDGLYRVELWTSTRYLTSDAVFVDTTAPVARIDDINNQTWTAIETKTVIGRASDDHFNDYTLDYQRSGTSTWTALTGQSNVSVYDNVIGKWVLGSDTVAPPTNGTYTVRLVVSDDAGNSTTSTVTVTLDLVAITNVTQNYKTVDLSANNFVVTYDLSVDADWVKIQIYPEQGGSLVKEIQVNTVTAGTGKTITWDGKNTAGDYVPREAYEFILIADAANSTSQYTYDPPKSSTATCGFTENGNTTDERNFNAFTNDVWKQEITVSSTSCVNGGRVWMIATPANGLYAKTNILNMVPYSPGVYDITWDGIDTNGLRVQGSVSFYYSELPPLPLPPKAFAFAKNVVIIDPSKLAPVVKGGTLTAPTVEIKSDPYLVYHSYDQFLHIDYNLDKASYVVIKLLPPGVTSFADPSAITVYDSGTCGLCSISGNQTLNWYGHDGTDTNDILVSDEGVYTYAIEATAVAGSVKNTVKGVVNLRR